MSGRKPDPTSKRRSLSSGPKRARILLVDDHPTMREGLARVIDETGDLVVCAQAESIHRALELMESTQPDLAIVDITLRRENGIELIKDLKIRHPQLPVLVHSMHDEQVYAQRSLRAGARGYLMKHEPPTRLLQAIRQVLAGEIYLSEAMTRQMLHHIADSPFAKGISPVERLSDRELQVFEQLGQGRKTKEIAADLHLSVKTVQTYCEHLKEKLQLQDSTSLTRFAVQWVEAQM
ncbi:MAG TPA: response regulator transcription factor [Verrucomicrobiae bacterium]|nr:response regulator transcription factor [Verrucomicrobiae bacterium]